MSRSKLMVIGMGSPSDKKLFDKIEIDGMTIDDFLAGKGIKRYHPFTNVEVPDDQEDDYLVTSIHRKTIDALKHADRMGVLAEENKLVGVFAGGLAFALPGLMAAQSITVPIVGVPTDVNGFYSTFPIPDGTPVGTVSVNGIARGIDLASRVLTYDPSQGINLVISGDCSKLNELTKYLSRFLEEKKSHRRTLSSCKSIFKIRR